MIVFSWSLARKLRAGGRFRPAAVSGRPARDDTRAGGRFRPAAVFGKTGARRHARRLAMQEHRQAALTPPETTKSDPAGGIARPSVVVARPLRCASIAAGRAPSRETCNAVIRAILL
jgi:hypothetical protein